MAVKCRATMATTNSRAPPVRQRTVGRRAKTKKAAEASSAPTISEAATYPCCQMIWAGMLTAVMPVKCMAPTPSPATAPAGAKTAGRGQVAGMAKASDRAATEISREATVPTRS